MVFHIARECRLERATLYAYVVMPHHVHMILRPRSNQTISQFMEKFKPNTGDAVARILSPAEIAQFSQQRGLNGNTFWQRSFRGLLIDSEERFWQKANYIHRNPVKAGYVVQPEQYRWSSASLYLKSHLSRESGLSYDVVVGSLRARVEEGESDLESPP